MASPPDPAEIADPWSAEFLAHLAADRDASVYTRRNYSQALTEFARWQIQNARPEAASPGAGPAVAWDKLTRDDFRSYLRHLGRNQFSRAATQLRFSALRTFYKFLIRHGQIGRAHV